MLEYVLRIRWHFDPVPVECVLVLTTRRMTYLLLSMEYQEVLPTRAIHLEQYGNFHDSVSVGCLRRICEREVL
jgi:hypothetical protein